MSSTSVVSTFGHLIVIMRMTPSRCTLRRDVLVSFLATTPGLTPSPVYPLFLFVCVFCLVGSMLFLGWFLIESGLACRRKGHGFDG